VSATATPLAPPRLLRTPLARVWAALLVLGYVVAPLALSDFWLSVLAYAGIAAIGAFGLNLLTGYTGQVSLGHAAFVGTGAYVAGWLGADNGLPLPLWLLGAALIGAALGAIIGPFALRLHGQYLVVVTLGLVVLGQHVFRNWKGLTGGNAGRAIDPPAVLGVDFNKFTLGGFDATRSQSWFWLIWAVVAIVALIAANLARSRAGRALQAVRDRALAAELTGVDVARTKVAVFALSSGLAALAGALLGSYQEFVSPNDWDLVLSIQYIAIVIVGGMGSVYGPVLGALFVGSLPRIIEEYSDSIPGVSANAGDSGFITVFALNQILFGLLIIGFLIAEPRGLTALVSRLLGRINGRLARGGPAANNQEEST
jgi:branched-chain amino acid transport system permease protein